MEDTQDGPGPRCIYCFGLIQDTLHDCMLMIETFEGDNFYPYLFWHDRYVEVEIKSKRVTHDGCCSCGGHDLVKQDKIHKLKLPLPLFFCSEDFDCDNLIKWDERCQIFVPPTMEGCGMGQWCEVSQNDPSIVYGKTYKLKSCRLCYVEDSEIKAVIDSWQQL